MRRKRIQLLSTLAASASLSLCAIAQNEIRLDAPIENFKAPLFNDEGYRSWHIKAEQAIYQNESEVKVLGLTARQFSGDEAGEVISTLEAKEGLYYLNNNLASGAGTLNVKSEEFELTGSAWIWQTKENRITFHKNAKIKIFSPIGDILK